MLSELFRTNPTIAILWVLAIPSTVILVLQTLLLLFGIGDNSDTDLDSDVSGLGDAGAAMDTDADTDINLDNDGDVPYDTGLRLITIRGIVAFFAVGSWSGISAHSLGAPNWLSVLIAVVFGFLAMVLVALFFKWAVKLQHDGTMRPHSAIGKHGEVYLTIGANRSASGKVNIVIQEQLCELNAVTDHDQPLKYGQRIEVVDVLGDNTLVVKPL